LQLRRARSSATWEGGGPARSWRVTDDVLCGLSKLFPNPVTSIASNPPRIDAKPGDYCLQQDFAGTAHLSRPVRPRWSAGHSLSPGLGADRGGQKTTVVLAHFLGHELVQQGVHAQDEGLVLLRVEGEIVRLERVVLQVKELDVVVAQKLFEGYRRIEVGGGVVTCKLVLSVESKTQESPFIKFGLVCTRFSRARAQRA